MAQIPLDIEEAAEKLIITLRTKVVFGCSPIEYREIKLLFAFALSQEREAVARELREAMWNWNERHTTLDEAFDSKLAELGINLTPDGKKD